MRIATRSYGGIFSSALYSFAFEHYSTHNLCVYFERVSI
ncbi:hypothetical protein CEV31_4062 [Brucella thiophenivorans]|uniref:Uncharacterized protein n=1 Tax=Brucella thiophenivorans TaxID=571255 RepID=A0A256EZD4_9HYPH|nr:hypothetical protein CEV31_4062 [Brucella thiophenivorans]